MIDPARLEAQRRALTATPRPLKLRGGRTGTYRRDMQTGIVCGKCHAQCISARNRSGLCRACWQSTGKRQRLEYRRAA